MADDSVTLEFLAQLSHRILDEVRVVHREVADVRTLSLQNHDYSRRLERRMGEMDRHVGELKDDLEAMLKAELMGRMAHMETTIEHMFQPIRGRLLDLDKLEQRLSTLERAET